VTRLVPPAPASRPPAAPPPGPCVVLHVIAPGPIGGAESVVAALGSARHALGRPTHVAALVSTADAPFVAALERAGVPVHPIVCGHRRYICEIRGVVRLARTVGASVLHTHVYRGDFAGYVAARYLRLPVVATYHGHTTGDWRNRLYEWLDRRLLAWFDAVLSVSAAGSKRLRRALVPQNKLHLVPSGYRPIELLSRSVARARLGLAGEGFTVGWVGRLSHEKGADLFLEAIGTLGDQRIQTIVIGDGSERSSLDAAARSLGLGPDRLRFAGPVPNAGALFSALDLLVLSSRREGLPIVLLEAMSAGVPVVAFAVGGIPEALPPTAGWLVAGGEPRALAAAIREVAQNPAEARRRAEVAREVFRDRFAEQRWVAEVDRIYELVLARRSPSRSTSARAMPLTVATTSNSAKRPADPV
jgi:glycosyltransferase involved in cell wall biosynthesis